MLNNVRIRAGTGRQRQARRVSKEPVVCDDECCVEIKKRVWLLMPIILLELS